MNSPYDDFISPLLKKYLLARTTSVVGVEDLLQLGSTGGLETRDSLSFLCQLYEQTKIELFHVLAQRRKDRKFIDERVRSVGAYNREFNVPISSKDYKTVLGLEDEVGRIVFGPKQPDYYTGNGKPVADIPLYLQGDHITLFGPPDDAKLCINAMNSYHRKLKNEPPIVQELLNCTTNLPMWGADDEDSKTPLRNDLVDAGDNLAKCLEGTLKFEDKKVYQLAAEKLALPIKRFPGLALPCLFLFYKNESIPLHLYDFALHLYRHWDNARALNFYVPKIENEEEARYLKNMIKTAEQLIAARHPAYKIGTVRLMIVLENPRAIFRVNEIMDELHPYFSGASLGWHDYLAATARLFREDPNYRIPVKADPNIVIKYIKSSHELMANVVGQRGGIKIGGMYGVLPASSDLSDPSFQVTLKGYFRDVITQLKRNLNGFWVAHPDFVRLGLALVQAWKNYKSGDPSKIENLVRALLEEAHCKEILSFIDQPDIQSLDVHEPLYARSLIVAASGESSFIANNHPDEIRYNVFQSLQYLADWLAGNGCVALPAEIAGVPVRVMDDLATAERSRWEVWHEIYHGRFDIADFLKIVHEEVHFIRRDLSDGKKIVQVKWDDRTAKWYPVAVKIMLKLMTDTQPVEFATELLLPFTDQEVRNSEQPWDYLQQIDSMKFSLPEYVEGFNYYFEKCGSLEFAKSMANNVIPDLQQVQSLIRKFSKSQIIEAASFHGDIGQNKKSLDAMAAHEQEKVTQNIELSDLVLQYINKFGMKFLVSAQGKTSQELLNILKQRMNNTQLEEIENAQEALWQITYKRLLANPLNSLQKKIEEVFVKYQVDSAQICLLNRGALQTICLGKAKPRAWFEMASLSKAVASAFSLEYFRNKKISIDAKVNDLLIQTKSKFRLSSDQVCVRHLLNHTALNMHYVNGVAADKTMPKIEDFLNGNAKYQYPPVEVINPPGTIFKYSGGGFLVLEHLIESLEEKSIADMTQPFLEKLSMTDFSFVQKNIDGINYASGFDDQGKIIEGTRKMFPAFAAGAMGTADAMAKFLLHLEKAYHQLEGSGPISHDTARTMLYAQDFGSQKFMGAKMGLGIFVAEAGPNKLAIHQGANDGFRAIFIHCFFGPDCGKGLVILCNGDLKGVLFNAEVAQVILKEFKFQGIVFSQFKTHFSMEHIPQQEIVNTGYKNLIFDAFIPGRAEEIVEHGELDPLSPFNLAVGAKIEEVSNEKFARAENLFDPHLPKFDPTLFGREGKIMDSWETVRHNLQGNDYLIFRLNRPSSINFILLSTKYHLGNHAPAVSIEGWFGDQWCEILPKNSLEGHSEKRIKLKSPTQLVSLLKISMFPDGGLSRLGLYHDLPAEIAKSFQQLSDATCVTYNEIIPQTSKPMSIVFLSDELEAKHNFSKLSAGQEFNNASEAYGAKIISASNEHYSPAKLVISPFDPINMFDGMESARSRQPGHYEEVIVALAKPARVHRIELDFTYFTNNNPMEISIDGKTQDGWVNLVSRVNVKAFAGNRKQIEIKNESVVEHIRVQTWPDGGMNRLKVFSRIGR